MQMDIQTVHGFNCSDMPEENETIADHFNLLALFPHIQSISYYLRSPEDCPFARGNWVIDLQLKNGELVAIKFPKEMTEKRFVDFLEPLLKMMKSANTH